MKVGVGIRPGTPVQAVLELVPLVDMVLIMTVEPGFGGQSFMAKMMPKVSLLRNLFPSLDIEVDGGLSPKTIDTAAGAGANMIVSGSAITGAVNPVPVIKILAKAVQKALEEGNAKGYFGDSKPENQESEAGTGPAGVAGQSRI